MSSSESQGAPLQLRLSADPNQSSQRELAQQVSLLRQILRDARCGIWEWHPHSGQRDFSGDIWGLFGETSDAAFMALWGDVGLTQVHVGDRDKVRDARQQLMQAPASIDLTFRAVTPSGRQTWLRWWGRSLLWPEAGGNHADNDVSENGDAGDNDLVLMGGCVDYTNSLSMRDQSGLQGERALWAVASVGDGLWEWDLRADEVVLDHACWAILGYDMSQVGADVRSAIKLWKSRVFPEDFPSTDQAFRDHVAQGLPLDVETRMWHRDGGVLWLRVRGQLQRDNEGNALRVLGVVQDVTGYRERQRRMEKELQEQSRESTARSELLLSMSHELRTPLNAILGYSQMIELDMSVNSEQRQRLGEIRRAGQHLLHLIGDVLELARIDSKRLEPSMEPVQPAALVADCKRLLEPLAETRRVNLIFEPLGWESAYIFADAVRFKQVVLNLAGNAVKYNRDNGRVVINFSPQPGGWLRLSILDTGKGIPEQRRAEVFEPFNRLGAESGGIEGSGVGLAIAKRLTEAMGGKIDFESHEDQGSVFWIEFPLIDAPVEVMQMSAKSQQSVQLPPSRILLVDSRPSSAARIQSLLRGQEEAQLLSATDAVEAIFIARTHPVDVVLFEHCLPGMSADDMQRVLQEDPSIGEVGLVLLGGPDQSRVARLPDDFTLVQLTKVVHRLKLAAMSD